MKYLLISDRFLKLNTEDIMLKKQNGNYFVSHFQIVLTIFLILIAFTPIYSQPAFPGAEGFGSSTAGGRGGEIIEVTNLNASGSGSFRAACEASGPRIVVFRIGGTIHINDHIRITSPFLTIAGQTAPGDGIQIKGPAGLYVKTHDVIIRGIRIRRGWHTGEPVGSCIGIGFGNSYNIVIDHCSFSWGSDETFTIWDTDAPYVHDITVQWSIISESLHETNHPSGSHSRPFIIGDYSQNVSVHHNLIAHGHYRLPEFKGGTSGEVINNVIYNWGKAGTDFGMGDESLSPVFANIIKNYYKPGVNSEASKAIYIRDDGDWGLVDGSKVYIDGNIGGVRNGGDRYLTTSPAFPPSGIKEQTADLAYKSVLDSAGALWPLRDAVDQRIVQETKDGTGSIIDSQDEVGGWPAFSSGTVLTDTDKDGMPDSWELTYGLNPNDYSDRNGTDLSSIGYTNVEVYLNGEDNITSIKEQIQRSGYHKTITCYPNPFNNVINIQYLVSHDELITINIFNIQGKLVRNLLNNKAEKPGSYTIQWYGKDNNGIRLENGVYLLTLVSNDNITVKRMILLK